MLRCGREANGDTGNVTASFGEIDTTDVPPGRQFSLSCTSQVSEVATLGVFNETRPA